MQLLNRLEWLLGFYSYPTPILKIRAGTHPVFVMDYAKKVKTRDNEYFLTYKLKGKFPVPRANETFINDKGKDVFPKVMLDDGTFGPLIFFIEEQQVYFCKSCEKEFNVLEESIAHLSKCDKLKGVGSS